MASAHNTIENAGWTRRRASLFVASISPFLALIALLAWGQVRTGGNPGGLVEHNESGEVSVSARTAPSFSGVDVASGIAIDNASLLGKTVMVDFWSSWCTACRIEAPDLADVYREYEGLPVEFVGLAIWDEAGDVLRYIDRFDVAYPIVIDDQGTTAVTYGVRGVPEKFFIDGSGTIVRKVIGPLTAQQLRDIIDSLLPS